MTKNRDNKIKSKAFRKSGRDKYAMSKRITKIRDRAIARQRLDVYIENAFSDIDSDPDCYNDLVGDDNSFVMCDCHECDNQDFNYHEFRYTVMSVVNYVFN